MNDYYYVDGSNKRQGPVAGNDLKNYGVKADSLVWTQGMANWTKASDVPELQPLFAAAPVAPQPAVTPQRAYEPQPYRQESSFKRNRGMMTFTGAIKKCLTKDYCCFSGRASRAEYWWFALFMFLIIFGLMFLAMIGFSAGSEGFGGIFIVLALLVDLGFILPSLGVCVRRLHDRGHSGWLWLINLIPYVGGIVIFVICVLDSEPGENEYGPEPCDNEEDAEFY